MSTDRKHSRELVRQLRAKALQVEKERGQTEGSSGNGGASREGSDVFAFRPRASGSSASKRTDRTSR
jgi:hypothetical protein